MAGEILDREAEPVLTVVSGNVTVVGAETIGASDRLVRWCLRRLNLGRDCERRIIGLLTIGDLDLYTIFLLCAVDVPEISVGFPLLTVKGGFVESNKFELRLRGTGDL